MYHKSFLWRHPLGWCLIGFQIRRTIAIVVNGTIRLILTFALAMSFGFRSVGNCYARGDSDHSASACPRENAADDCHHKRGSTVPIENCCRAHDCPIAYSCTTGPELFASPRIVTLIAPNATNGFPISAARNLESLLRVGIHSPPRPVPLFVILRTLLI